MQQMIQQLWNRYKEVVLYLFFGVCTTLVNIFTYYVCAHTFALGTVPSTCVAWFLSVLFAYITNKLWVFESKSLERAAVVKEMTSFFSCRVATGLMDLGFMYVFVDVLRWNDMVVKVISNFFVIVLNYLASKLLIFKN